MCNGYEKNEYSSLIAAVPRFRRSYGPFELLNPAQSLNRCETLPFPILHYYTKHDAT